MFSAPRRAAALAAAALLLCAQAVDVPYDLCSAVDNLGISQVDISEWPIHPGHSVTFHLKFAPKVDIAAGKLSLAVTLRGAEVFSDSHDLCSGTDLACPLAAGQEVAISKTQTIPENTPPLKGLKVKVVTVDGNGTALSCIEADIALASNEEELARLPAIDGSLLGDIAMSRPTTWTAHWSPRFANATLKQASGMMGTWLRGHPLHMELPPKEAVFGLVPGMEDNDTIPVSFDAREAWPACKDVIGKVKDQSACGSCWAFASSSAFEDRMCIAHGSTELLSPTDTLSCCTGAACGFSQGCNGGQPAGAWSFFSTTGIVTGGLFEEVGSGSSCLPYPFLTCAHHVEDAQLPACPAEDFETPRCRKTCSESEYKAAYYADKRKATRGYSVRTVEGIQREIMENGPVSAAFNVYQDFLTYEGGVYQHASGMPLGGHAVKLIGWGEEAGVPYWLVVNSWNPSWGEKGLFRIIRGQDE